MKLWPPTNKHFQKTPKKHVPKSAPSTLREPKPTSSPTSKGEWPSSCMMWRIQINFFLEMKWGGDRAIARTYYIIQAKMQLLLLQHSWNISATSKIPWCHQILQGNTTTTFPPSLPSPPQSHIYVIQEGHKAINDGVGGWEGWVGEAECHDALGDDGAAAECYKHAVKLNPRAALYNRYAPSHILNHHQY